MNARAMVWTLTGLVLAAGCQSGNGGRSKEPVRASPPPARSVPAAKPSAEPPSNAISVSVATRDGERLLEGQLERSATRVTAGPPVWQYHMVVRNLAKKAATFEYRVRFHDGYGREHRTFGSYKWRPERLAPSTEKEFVGEMPWVRVNTIALEARPASVPKGEMDKAK